MLRAELTRARKEAACRQHIGAVIARYFIKQERSADIMVPSGEVRVDSDPAWVPGMLERRELTEPEFAVFRFFPKDGGTILDLGANFGYSAASIWATGCCAPILSFEPNRWHEACLARIKEMRAGQYDFRLSGLGSTTSEVRFTMPVIEGTGISGLASAAIELETDWAIPENVLHYMVHYVPDVALPRLQFTETTWPIGRLDDLLAAGGFDVPIETIAAAKIDVEGYEPDLIAGGLDTLRRHRPLVMVEGANRVAQVVRQLLDLGYCYADFSGDRLTLSDRRSDRVSGFFLHGTRLEEYRRLGVLTN